MNTHGLGIGASWQKELDPSIYDPGSLAEKLARELAPLISAERQARRDAERIAHDADPAAAATRANLFGGLLGPMGVPGLDFFAVDSTPWHDLLTDVEFLARCAQAVGLAVGGLAQAIVDHLMPPNWLVFFWMARALESVPIGMAQQWSQDAAATAAAEVAETTRRAAAQRSKAKADVRWMGTRNAKEWWQQAWAGAKAANPKLEKRTFVKRQWQAYVSQNFKPLVDPDTVAAKWLRGQ